MLKEKTSKEGEKEHPGKKQVWDRWNDIFKTATQLEQEV